MKAKPEAAAAAPAGGSKKKMIIIIAAVLLLVGGGAGWFLLKPKGEHAAEHKVEKVEPPEYLQVESFTVNLQPEGEPQYLQIAMTLQVQGPKAAEEIKANMAKVRNRILLLLSGKKASEISTVEGKQQLAKEIVTSVKEPFVAKGQPQKVDDVLFTAFIIQ
ncbi:MAG: flagellar basal body-associated protein FliL [Hyphomicrobiales bacterium]|nr:flagellar basal body-associated protein FliL [Hyphomicrobiales bacterium]